MLSTAQLALTANWQPLLTGSWRDHALMAVREIAASLPGALAVDQSTPAALACDQAAAALLYAYLAVAEDDAERAAAAVGFLNEASGAVATEVMRPALYGGFTTIGWVMANLAGVILTREEADNAAALDEILCDLLTVTPWQGRYDLISGLVGFGVYALERLPDPAAVECLRRVVARLAETAEQQAAGVTWHTAPELLPDHQRELCPGGYYNLGLAHGVPGVIALLARACAVGVERERAGQLLDGAVRWLLAQRLPREAGASFATWAAPGIEPKRVRLAWCYGDLGAGAALLDAARCVDEEAWEQAALEILQQAAQFSLAGSGVKDTSLCHGAAGIAHVFNRVYQATGREQFGAAARAWYEHTLALRQPGQGVAGFVAWNSEMEGGVEADPGFLMGAAGIGLALLAACTPVEPQWDRTLLVSIPPRGNAPKPVRTGLDFAKKSSAELKGNNDGGRISR